jgi:hypothetical protein
MRSTSVGRSSNDRAAAGDDRSCDIAVAIDMYRYVAIDAHEGGTTDGTDWQRCFRGELRKMHFEVDEDEKNVA